MRTIVKVAGMGIMVMLMGTMTLNAQRGLRGKTVTDTVRLERPDWNMQGMGPGMMPGRMQGMRHFQGDFMPPVNGMHGMKGMRGGRQFGGQAYGPGSHRAGRPGFGDGAGPAFGMNNGFRGGFPGIESLPGLTDKQKEDFKSLREKQQAEMKKLRDDFMAKAKDLRSEQRKKMTDMLTPEQKKELEKREEQLKDRWGF